MLEWPRSGKHGGEIIGTGTLEELKQQDSSVTGAYLQKQHQQRTEFRPGTGEVIEIKHANLYNLKNLDVSFPTGCLIGYRSLWLRYIYIGILKCWRQVSNTEWPQRVRGREV